MNHFERYIEKKATPIEDKGRDDLERLLTDFRKNREEFLSSLHVEAADKELDIDREQLKTIIESLFNLDALTKNENLHAFNLMVDLIKAKDEKILKASSDNIERNYELIDIIKEKSKLIDIIKEKDKYISQLLEKEQESPSNIRNEFVNNAAQENKRASDKKVFELAPLVLKAIKNGNAKSEQDIANYFNEAGKRTRRGEKFSRQAINRLVKKAQRFELIPEKLPYRSTDVDI